MKKLVFISGAISIALIPIGILFKLMHWPLAGIIFVIGVAIFSFLFVPICAKYLYDKN